MIGKQSVLVNAYTLILVLCGNKCWLLVVGEFSNMCWSVFLQRKSELPKRMMELIRKLRTFQQIDIQHGVVRMFAAMMLAKTKFFKDFVKKMLSLLILNLLPRFPAI
jgi:hypothetical protein